ncbi:FHA domain-containing protein [Stenotrophomonas sp. C4297]|uniref:FHA domain-containing protein n=1 Tax=Stenotrophomonas TaxID=40323 RepID=UPI000EB5FE0C|nr:FHA domain-containing protein [Stenotrophomonas sp. C4297]MDV3510751.1 FHA domain-containing protein [Stenotrophomonas sp. C4297]HEL4830249.1 FHA domain-containing protein [Stenotrophomonas maltophilia]
MQNLLVHFSQQQQPDQPLRPGVQRIVRQANGSVRLGDAGHGALLLAQFCVDDRGLWLQVGNGIRGIHVNGRPVRRMALLRAGDAVYVDGVEMVLQGEVESLLQAPAPNGGDGTNEQQRLLRGVGGLHHGRSFTLSRSRLIGRGGDADIEINEPAFAEQHARVEVHGERVLLRDLGSADGTRVNGVAVRHCWLQAGDQVVFDGQHRFVLEVPHDPRRRPLPDEDESSQDAEQAPVLPAAPRKVRRWPWLLVSALLLAALLSLLLWFGAR